MLFSLLPYQPSLRAENHYSSTQNQNNELINSSSLKLNRLLFLEIKCRKASFLHWLFRSLGIAIGSKVFESDQNFKFSFYTFTFRTAFKNDKSLKMLLRQRKCSILTTKEWSYIIKGQWITQSICSWYSYRY